MFTGLERSVAPQQQGDSGYTFINIVFNSFYRRISYTYEKKRQIIQDEINKKRTVSEAVATRISFSFEKKGKINLDRTAENQQGRKSYIVMQIIIAKNCRKVERKKIQQSAFRFIIHRMGTHVSP